MRWASPSTPASPRMILREVEMNEFRLIGYLCSLCSFVEGVFEFTNGLEVGVASSEEEGNLLR